MFIINFLKSLIIPKDMKKYKGMNVFISIGIFILISYFLALPYSQYISKHRYEIVDKQNSYGLNIFKNLQSEDILTLKKTGFKVEKLSISWSDDIKFGEAYTFDLIDEEGQQSEIFVVFDLYDLSDVTQEKPFDIQTGFYDVATDENIDYYLLVFYSDSILYRSPEQTTKQPLYYLRDVSIDFANLDETSYLTHRIMDLYMSDIKTELTFNTFISSVLLTFLIILILWLFFRIMGSIYTFKEFYNIGAMASIVPLIFTVILSYIFPKELFFTYYSSIFGVYYLLMIIIINKNTKIA